MANLKNLSSDPRIRGIFQKHLSALSREIAQELTQPLLEHWGLTNEDLGLVGGPVVDTTAEPIVPAALVYDAKARRWICPRCRVFSDPRRRSVTAHLRFCKAEAEPKRPSETSARRVWAADRAAKRAVHAASHTPRNRRQSKKKP